MTRLRDWLDARTGYGALLHKALDEPVLGGARWAYVFGSVLAILFTIQIVTGMLLAVYYSPSSREAWGSVHFITHELTLGWFVRGLHHWGSSAMVVLLAFHVSQVFIFGAYRPPRELAWWTGLFLLFLTLGFSLTGYLLPWDQRGYWATRVTTSIAGTLPLVGERIKTVLQGGNDFGTLTLTRFFVFHAFLLPAALILMLVVHVALFRRNGATPHWSRSKEDLQATTEPLWPRQLTYDMAFAAAVLTIIVGLTLRDHGAPLGGPADPSANYPARPEWYFLWMFQLLKFLPGAWEGVGISLAGTVAVIFLAALPLVDRQPSRALVARWPLFLMGGVVLFAIVGLTVVPAVEDIRDPAFMAQKREAEANARRAFALARIGIPPGGTEDLYLNDPYEHGKRVFETLCQACHKINGKGSDSAPDLTGYLTHPWVRRVIVNPNAPELYGRTTITSMPPSEAKPDEVEQITHYVLSLGGHASPPNRGEDLFEDNGCQACHAREGEDPRRGPSLAGFGSREWVRGIILEPAAPRYFGSDNRMPSFQGKLSDSELDDLLTYLLSMRMTEETAGGKP